MNFDIFEAIPRAALVTGGDQPAGLAVAKALKQAGFAVALQTSATGLTPDYPCLIVGLGDEAQVASLPAWAAAAIGPIGVLVNAARLERPDTWRDATPDAWNAHMAINLRAPLLAIQNFAQQLPAGAEGVAINLLDRDIHALAPDRLSYALSQSALWTLTQTLALALAPRIRVNAIADGGPEEIARAVLAILAFRSMTGQMIRPDGTRPNEAPPPGV